MKWIIMVDIIQEKKCPFCDADLESGYVWTMFGGVAWVHDIKWKINRKDMLHKNSWYSVEKAYKKAMRCKKCRYVLLTYPEKK